MVSTKWTSRQWVVSLKNISIFCVSEWCENVSPKNNFWFSQILKQIKTTIFTHDTSQWWVTRIKKTSIFILLCVTVVKQKSPNIPIAEAPKLVSIDYRIMIIPYRSQNIGGWNGKQITTIKITFDIEVGHARIHGWVAFKIRIAFSLSLRPTSEVDQKTL